jgi:hypothetical protein
VPPFFAGGAPLLGSGCATTPTAPSSMNRIINEPHWITSA